MRKLHDTTRWCISRCHCVRSYWRFIATIKMLQYFCNYADENEFKSLGWPLVTAFKLFKCFYVVFVAFGTRWFYIYVAHAFIQEILINWITSRCRYLMYTCFQFWYYALGTPDNFRRYFLNELYRENIS